MKKSVNYQKIVETARLLYFRFGYSRITVEEIAREMKISKKTIYNHFTGKREILDEVIELIKQKFQQDIEAAMNQPGLTYREILKAQLTVVGMWLNDVAVFSKDIREHVPNAWEVLNQFKKEAALMYLNNLLAEGVRQGFLQENDKTNMGLLIFLISVENLLDPRYRESLPPALKQRIPHTPEQVFNGIVDVIFDGIKDGENRG